MSDSTGTVFYPSGRIAITIIKTTEYKSFLVFSDHENSILLALFDSNSNCYCNYLNGKLRFQINCNGGINFDSNGCCIRRWIWPNDEKLNTFHPMNFNINEYMGVYIENRHKIVFNFRTKYGSSRFLVGAKINVGSCRFFGKFYIIIKYKNYLRKQFMSNLVPIISNQNCQVYLVPA